MHVIETGFEVAAVILLAVLGRAAIAYFSPYRKCRWCRPGGLYFGSVPAWIIGHKPRPRRKRRCWRCKGTRMTRRLCAKTVHKMKLSVQQAWAERGSLRADQTGGDS
jgi:hypothetical protein